MQSEFEQILLIYFFTCVDKLLFYVTNCEHSCNDECLLFDFLNNHHLQKVRVALRATRSRGGGSHCHFPLCVSVCCEDQTLFLIFSDVWLIGLFLLTIRRKV